MNNGYRTQSEDTSYEIERMLVERWQKMPFWEKAARMSDLTQTARRLAALGAQQRFPKASEEEIHLYVASLSYGREIVEEAYGKKLTLPHPG